MHRDEQIGLGGIIAVTIVAFLCCVAVLAAIDSSGHFGVLGGESHQQRAMAEQAKLRSPGFYTEYDFEAYYAEKAARGEDGDVAEDEPGAKSTGHAKKSSRGKSSRRSMPELPDGLKLGNSRVKTVTGKPSKIEIIDVGGSMEPVDIYAETGAAITQAAPGSIASRTRYWPMPNRVHHAASSVPSSLSTYQEVAGYIGRHESNEAQRVKAIHDFLGLKLTYDYDSLKPGQRKSQQPKQVFDSGLAVCEGYARLFKAMAGELGIEAEYVRGLSRTWLDGKLDNQYHAWNSVKVGGKWYLVDATWADTSGPYTTDYLFVPGEVLSATHFPRQTRWQLRKRPISKSEFFSGAHLKPSFHAEGLGLISPKKGNVNVVGDAIIEIDNPARRYVHASIRPKNKRNGERRRCDVKGTTRLTITCPTKIGKQTVVVFAGASRRSVKFVAALHVNRR